MSASEPLFSILINNYNYGMFLPEAIDSALQQTYPNTEVIVVDDGSTDNSHEIIASYGDRIIPVLKENGGQASAFNAGFATSHGEWICLLDSDDVFLPAKVEEVVRLARENPTIGLIAHNLSYCDAAGTPIEFGPLPIPERKLLDERKRARRGKLTALLPATSGLCLRRDALERILPMPEEVRGQPDNYIKFVALSLAQVLLVPEALTAQRIHDWNRYTSSCYDDGETARVNRVWLNAEVTFYLKKCYPQLSALAWKQYGRILYQLMSLRSQDSRWVRREIRSQFNVLEFSPRCLFYVGGTFTKAFLRGCLYDKSKP